MMNEKKPKWVCPVCNKTGMNIFNHLLKIWKKSKIRPRSVQTKEKRSNTRKEILMLLSHKIKVTKVKSKNFILDPQNFYFIGDIQKPT